MLALAFVLLLVAATGGLAMAVLDVAAPAVRTAHGGIAGLGLLVLLIGALMHGQTLVWTAFGLLAIGFAAGAVLFGLVWRERAPPRLVVAGHGLINAAGIVLLGVAIFA
ncbi:hypothetical protein SAOR_10040 [Salinisphaera orenii MK-B5]|uniref:Uncharacterized protein n=1 Tax=Salinisphaera orenii MK-B5 TaxID=856730 RepID=A0A423PM43_9GAMM|nr:hypothetical protein [Salinisphaera orenii]ROO26673.1 hypothetical protein SAOR_10040 [Salinisphaera orenii MK-B5]